MWGVPAHGHRYPPILLTPATPWQAPEPPFGGSDSSQMLTSERAAVGRQPDRGGGGGLPGQGQGLHPAAGARASFPTARASSERNSDGCWNPPPKAPLSLSSAETRDFAIIKVASRGQAKQFTTFREAAEQNQRTLEFRPQPRALSCQTPDNLPPHAWTKPARSQH